ncbi:multifunctional 2',3'-cyclic-nucleotide 2'-phosphodiesterase/5'-nucleotidase/3'-nucleotidase [Roseovarius faecimaris]|uniref:Multifunctional 2',3'-cyclic-nucleotide 2'-phosphodiesterase/5'-nucleotidase/3'-nucleotidase n=1 Tax=Roseovarius faecimaris TaxID=2494550 RepID=A0A6I6IZ59_9RHOB|nr:bifunctional metallophosphatase/5'-nucleotidase [Roseovarius faecimaris]QGX97918.1 multifunctional 2',3'-cyclic-nucleotide 2'-phosphodiesterase/5'-nucleotidase/3'-nucleotidase [Roseovarius faecimaris]
MLHRALATTALTLCASMAVAEFELTILHTNDFHARFEPITRYDNTCKEDANQAGECYGGSARLATAISDARGRHENTILVDGGDQFQGTLFYTYYKGTMAAKMMNKMGYDAMTVGNHEFDDGPEVLRGFMDALNFPILMSNADVSGEKYLAGVLKKSTVISRGGERIGLIGVTPQNTDELASPGPYIVFYDPVDGVQTQVNLLRDQGINKIIVLSHSGYLVDQRIAAETEGVDVIVGGHSNTYLHSDDEDAAGPYPTMVGNTAIVQAYAYGKFLGELNVVFDDDGELVSAVGAPLIMDASVHEDESIKARVTEAAIPLDKIRNEVVGEAVEAIDGSSASCRAGPCAMGIAMAEAMLGRVRDQGIDVAITNGGGVRSGIDMGEITKGEVLTVAPFQNTMSTFRLTGAQIVAALENGFSQVGEDAGRFPQVAGMTVTYDASAEPGSRVRDVTVGGAPLEMDKLYGVVSNNYLRGGGDGYRVFVDAEDAYDFGPDVADVLADYLSLNSPFTPMVDDRIKPAE